MKANDELIAEQLRTDPEFHAEWKRTVLARAVAIAILKYRGKHHASQRELADLLGMKQPQVARLELGDVNPSIETLMRISAQLGIEFTIDVRPAGHRPTTSRGERRPITSSAHSEPTTLRFSSRRGRNHRSRGLAPPTAPCRLQ